MPLARLGWTIVLSVNESRTSAPSDHMASESSPVLRRKLLRTTESVTRPLKLRPSAARSRKRLFSITAPFVVPFIVQMPHLRCCIHRPEMTEPLPSGPW